MNETHPFQSSLRRELRENRFLYVAPLAVMAVVLFASFIALATLPHRFRKVPAGDMARQHTILTKPVSMAPAPVILFTLIAGLLYSLDALYGERRDRSILFWKSLPVSDTTTVLAKASIPIVVLPLFAYILGLTTEFVLLLLSVPILGAQGMNPFRIWSEYHFLSAPLIMIYGIAVHALWFAPIYAWFILISAWARRAPFLWAILPPAAIVIVERIVFNTHHFGSLIGYRFSGAMIEAFGVDMTRRGDHGDIESLSQLTPLRYLGSAGFWLGLLFAAICLGAAIRLRRYREPI